MSGKARANSSLLGAIPQVFEKERDEIMENIMQFRHPPKVEKESCSKFKYVIKHSA